MAGPPKQEEVHSVPSSSSNETMDNTFGEDLSAGSDAESAGSDGEGSKILADWQEAMKGVVESAQTREGTDGDEASTVSKASDDTTITNNTKVVAEGRQLPQNAMPELHNDSNAETASGVLNPHRTEKKPPPRQKSFTLGGGQG